MRQSGEAVAKVAEKNLTKAEQRAAKLSEVSRPGKDFIKAGKEAVKDVNVGKNGSKMKCQECGQSVKNGEKHSKMSNTVF